MKKVYKVICLMLVIILTSAGCSKDSLIPHKSTPPLSSNISKGDLNKYLIQITYDRDHRTAAGHEKIVFTNNENVPLSDIVLHLYPNAYKSRETVPIIGKLEDSFPKGFNPGGITVSSVKLGNRKTSFTVNNMIMKISLERPLAIGEGLNIDMDFSLKLPQCRARYGTYKGISQFMYWYPILAVYDKGWQPRSYNPIGESNYSEIADYDINVNVPAEEIVAATGSIVEERPIKQGKILRKTVHIKAASVRDFVWACSKDYIMKETEAEGIKIKSYYIAQNRELGSKVNELAANVLKYYNSSFGKYPYKEFSIIESYLAGGAMEYPELIALGQNYYTDIGLLEHAIAHEGAHQWWYVIVGNDEYTYPWLDESFAVYSTELYTAYKSKNNDQLKADIQRYRLSSAPHVAIGTPVSSFGKWTDYSAIAYKKGAVALHDLRSLVGDAKFSAIMKAYYKGYMFKNATTQDFIKIVEGVGGKKAADWLTKLLYEPAL